MSTADTNHDISYGDPPPEIEASISALTCSDGAVWDPDGPDPA